MLHFCFCPHFTWAHEKCGKNKSIALIILFSVILVSVYIYIHDPIGALRNSESFCDAMVQLTPLIMSFVRFLYIIYSLFESPGKMKSLQFIGQTYNVFIKLWSR